MKRIERTPIMHRIVENAGVLYLGGITATDTSLDMAGQTRQTCERLQELLLLAGSDKSKILSTIVYISDFSMKNAMNEAWIDWFDAEELPARATLGVADLGPNVLIEVVATATT